MYTKQDALEKMEEYVNFLNELYQENFPGEYKIIIRLDLTQEKDFGWIFYYSSNNDSFQLAGNGPIIVEKETLDMYEMATVYPEEESIEMYLEDKYKLGKLEKDDDDIWDTVNL